MALLVALFIFSRRHSCRRASSQSYARRKKKSVDEVGAVPSGLVIEAPSPTRTSKMSVGTLDSFDRMVRGDDFPSSDDDEASHSSFQEGSSMFSYSVDLSY